MFAISLNGEQAAGEPLDLQYCDLHLQNKMLSGLMAQTTNCFHSAVEQTATLTQGVASALKSDRD